MSEKKYFNIPDDWEYRGEGNCHLVLGLPKMKTVLRIRKKDKPKNIMQWFLYLVGNYLPWWKKDGEAAERRDLNLYLRVMRPFFGLSFTANALYVRLSKKQMKKIESQLDNLRPDFRKCKVLDIERACLFEDLTYMTPEVADIYSIEIKPKKAWAPATEREFPECIFCMNQYLKLKNGKISKRSKYCPKDLFSGDEYKMKKAISALIADPQNNFRIFKNGRIVYDENKTENEVDPILEELFDDHVENREEMINEFVHMIYKCLTKPMATKTKCTAQAFCVWDLALHGRDLPKGCVLEKILSAQMIDMEGVSFYKNLINDNCPDWDYIERLMENLDLTVCVKCFLRALSYSRRITNDSYGVAVYIISAIASDCSVMLTMNRKTNQENIVEEAENNIVTTKYGSYQVKIGVLDLGPKPASTITKHHLRNKELLALMLENGKK